MTALAVPEGLEPLAVWDTRDKAWHSGPDPLWRAAASIGWAVKHIPNPGDACRVEFYLLDVPFAAVTRFKHDADGRKCHDPATDSAATEPPVIVPLAELPPAHLLRG